MATLPKAAVVLKNNGIIVHQTDTVLGLACLPKEPLLQRLTQVKLRSLKKGFILLASSIEQIHDYVQVAPEFLKEIKPTSPRSTTWLVKANTNIAASLIGETHKVAVRLTDHQSIKLICEKVGAIASTSANLSSLNTCSQLEQARNMFGPQIDYLEPIICPGSNQASRIIDLASGNIIRE